MRPLADVSCRISVSYITEQFICDSYQGDLLLLSAA